MARRILVLACLLLVLRLAPAQEVVFYKCTDAKGQVSMQNGTPCAAGMKQEIRRIGSVMTVPVPQRKPKAEEAPPAAPQYGEFVLVSGPQARRAPAPEAAGLPAAPPLYHCKRWDGEGYIGEAANPPPRCVPLEVRGIDGSATLGMGQACEMKEDQCTEVPAAQLCDTWYRRLDDADFKLRYADDGSKRERQAAFDAIAAAIKASRCATEAPAASRVP